MIIGMMNKFVNHSKINGVRKKEKKSSIRPIKSSVDRYDAYRQGRFDITSTSEKRMLPTQFGKRQQRQDLPNYITILKFKYLMSLVTLREEILLLVFIQDLNIHGDREQSTMAFTQKKQESLQILILLGKLMGDHWYMLQMMIRDHRWLMVKHMSDL